MGGRLALCHVIHVHHSSQLLRLSVQQYKVTTNKGYHKHGMGAVVGGVLFEDSFMSYLRYSWSLFSETQTNQCAFLMPNKAHFVKQLTNREAYRTIGVFHVFWALSRRWHHWVALKLVRLWGMVKPYGRSCMCDFHDDTYQCILWSPASVVLPRRAVTFINHTQNKNKTCTN